MLTPEEIAKMLYDGIQQASNYSERSMQGRDFKIGVSDLGLCSERTKRMLEHQIEPDTDALAAWLGTAIGRELEEVAQQVWPDALVQEKVVLQLESDTRTYSIPGSPDIIIPSERLVLDGKTVDGLETVRRTGPTQQQQFQRHCYGLGAWEGGLLGDIPLEDVRVGNVWIDRSGRTKELHVDVEPLDMDVIRSATEWLDEVIYAYLETAAGRPTDARKEPAREFCAVACGFYRECRLYDTDVEGLLRDPVVLTSVEMYEEGRRLEKQGARLKREAKTNLQGVSGSTGAFLVRWTHVNESEIPATTRAAYDKLTITPTKGGESE